jgi:hypothetical protein
MPVTPWSASVPKVERVMGAFWSISTRMRIAPG